MPPSNVLSCASAEFSLRRSLGMRAVCAVAHTKGRDNHLNGRCGAPLRSATRSHFDAFPCLRRLARYHSDCLGRSLELHAVPFLITPTKNCFALTPASFSPLRRPCTPPLRLARPSSYLSRRKYPRMFAEALVVVSAHLFHPSASAAFRNHLLPGHRPRFHAATHSSMYKSRLNCAARVFPAPPLCGGGSIRAAWSVVLLHHASVRTQ